MFHVAGSASFSQAHERSKLCWTSFSVIVICHSYGTVARGHIGVFSTSLCHRVTLWIFDSMSFAGTALCWNSAPYAVFFHVQRKAGRRHHYFGLAIHTAWNKRKGHKISKVIEGLSHLNPSVISIDHHWLHGLPCSISWVYKTRPKLPNHHQVPMARRQDDIDLNWALKILKWRKFKHLKLLRDSMTQWEAKT